LLSMNRSTEKISQASPRSLHIFFSAMVFHRTLLGKSKEIPRKLAPMLSMNRLMSMICPA
jgi:hypothetical protein